MKRTWPIGLGKVVRSKNGRDEGREFIVTALEGDFAYVADGDTRKIEKPKKKRARHLFVTEETISSLQEKLEAGAAQGAEGAQAKGGVRSCPSRMLLK